LPSENTSHGTLFCEFVIIAKFNLIITKQEEGGGNCKHTAISIKVKGWLFILKVM
jgi:hypothetical protein